MRAIGYIRVSSREQSQEGLSLGVQEQNIRAYCELRGLELVDLISDPGVSASKPLQRRKGGSALLGAVRAKRAGNVVAVKLDRLFRDAADCLATVRSWEEASVGLHLTNQGGASIDSTSAMGRFFLTIMAGVAEMERNLIRERTQEVLDSKRESGERIGHIPFGMKLGPDGRLLVPDEGEQQTIAYLQRLRGEGLSYAQVAARLNTSATSRARKGVWTKKKVIQILQRPAL